MGDATGRKNTGPPARPKDEHGRERSSKSGQRPCSGLVAAFGSVWVPNCARQDASARAIDLKTNKVVATIAGRPGR